MRWGRVGLVAVVTACDPDMALVGKPCTPPTEDDPTFLGADPGAVTLFASNDQLAQGAITCMAFHFRGRVACPYGQDATGSQLPAVDGAAGGPFTGGADPCVTPTGQPVAGEVEPQCADRLARDTVTYTCRCANADGKTDDGATYCSCPSDTTICSQLVVCPYECASPYSGAFCIPKRAIGYDPSAACLGACDPTSTTCI